MSETPPHPAEPPVEPAAEPVAEAVPTAVIAEDAAAVAPTTAQPAAPEATADTAPAAAAAPAVPDLSPTECAAQLTQRFPGLFAAGRALPIKLRIHADIHARAPGVFTKKALSLFLHRYTTTTAYLKALVGEKQRFDLDGAPAGEVADEHLVAAGEELERRRAIVDTKRQAMRQQQREQRPQPPRRPAPAAGGTDGAASGAPDASAPGAPRPGGPRPPRPERFSKPRAPGPRSQGPRPMPRRGDGASAPRPVAAAPTVPPAPTAPPVIEDPARRERALLLRTFESSTLTKANFCVLKRMTEAELDAQLTQARQDRGERPFVGKTPR